MKRRRSAKACIPCRNRKVRCDCTVVGIPCSTCHENEVECYTIPRKQRLRRDSAKSAEPNTSQSQDLAELPDRRSEVSLQLDHQDHVQQSFSTRTASHRGLDPLVSDLNNDTSTFLPPESLEQHSALHSIPHYPFLDNLLSASSQHQAQLAQILVDIQRASCDEPLTSDKTCGQEELRYLDCIGAFELPQKDVLRRFVQAYFATFHPFFPIIDRTRFLRSFDNPTSPSNNPAIGNSLLLLHAVLLVASAIVPQELIELAGFTDRKLARKHFYTKARRLYDMDYEDDTITTIQALLLISQYYPSILERKHTWHWIHQAISLAHVSGLHRYPGNTAARSLWSRIWWACVVRDRCNGLGTGRPLMINSLDCSVNMLTIEDLTEDEDSPAELTVKIMFIEFSKLCQCIEAILTLQYSMPNGESSGREQFDICERSLESWLRHLPPEAQKNNSNRLAGDHDIIMLYRCILHAAYNTLKIALHQTPILWDLAQNRSTYHQEQMELAALDNTQMFSDLINLGLVKHCPTIAVTFTLSPLVVHVLGIRSSYLREKRRTYQNRFDSCMIFLDQLGDIYWHARFYAQFFYLAASIVKQESPQSTGDALTSFLYQPISLGHLLILQRYQNEMRQAPEDRQSRIPSLSYQNEPTSPQKLQYQQQMPLQSLQGSPQEPQPPLHASENSISRTIPVGLDASGSRTTETRSVNDWLRQNFGGSNIVPFA